MPMAENVRDQIGAPCTRTFNPFISARFLNGLFEKMLRTPPPALPISFTSAFCSTSSAIGFNRLALDHLVHVGDVAETRTAHR